MASDGCVVRHGHRRLYPVQSEYAARMVESKRGSVPCQNLTESSPMHSEMVYTLKVFAKAIDRSVIDFLDRISRVNTPQVLSIVA
ncbi:UNVERIFIED_CONTAM: hypothetical protein Sradi_5835400 [Sesamum radiatum]|uniref:Uncharacterized protein n=1 Tax=Sesamum radiatum TaxID=300843 RepID=A0AAW2KRX1_SESRA